jgi:secondary thiamine-phosphate synthase enzyme
MASRLSPISTSAPQTIASAALTVETRGPGFTDITRDVRAFLRDAGAAQGMLLVYLRHTSASLVIQENADPAVQTDLMTALERLAPQNAGWVHGSEGPDDMPAHIKAMLNGVSVSIPVDAGAPVLGTWQGIYLVEHRTAPHRREVALQYIGARA